MSSLVRLCVNVEFRLRFLPQLFRSLLQNVVLFMMLLAGQWSAGC